MSQSEYDVIILGGGLAGLSLALQLKKAIPDYRILVTERREHPVPEIGFKVGESTVEMAARYFADVIDMKEHLDTEHLFKPGLRFFFSNDGNRDIKNRVEVGHSFWPKHKTYQIDRGKFENAMGEACRTRGIDFMDDSKVQNFTLNPGDRHEVSIIKEGTTHTFTARWVVDASGRSALIKRQLGLEVDIAHDCDAVWFRLNDPMDIDTWSDDPEWLERAPRGLRMYATNHLMGKGYWVWLIALAPDSISIGIVTDPAYHKHSDLNTFDKALQWLWKHEPQCAAKVEEKRDTLVDFRLMRRYARDCSKVFSEDRWAITGKAGVFPDPFYSPGSDMISFSNTMITTMIAYDQMGVDLSEVAPAYDGFYLDQFHGVLNQFEGLYPVWGHPQTMAVKILWDSSNYWGVSVLLAYQDKLTDLTFLQTTLDPLIRQGELGYRMQAFFGEWAKVDDAPRRVKFLDQYRVDYLYDMHLVMAEPHTEDELRERIAYNVETVEMLAVAIVERAKPYLTPEIIAATEEWLPKVTLDYERLAGFERVWLELATEPETLMA